MRSNREQPEPTASDASLNRRSVLLGGTAIIAAAATLATVPATRPARAQPAGGSPNILFIMADDIGWFNLSIYNNGMMGYRTPNIDRIGKEGANLHRLVRRAELHCRSRRIHYRPVADPDRPDQGRLAGRRHWPARRRPELSPNSSSRSATRRASSARTISATRMSSFRRTMASMSSSATSITSMPRKSQRTRTIRRTRSSASGSARAA